MRNYFATLLLIGLFLSANTVRAIENFSGNFIGKLGSKTEVIFSLKSSNGKLTGFYFYDKIGIEIKLAGEVINGNAIIYELDDQNVKQAKITGKLSANGFSGKWESLTAKKTFPLQLKSTSKAIPTLPKNLIGTYQADERDKCALNIAITKSKGEYFYHFKNLKRSLNGKVTFSRSLDENLVYINFHGIEWEEDSGDVTKEDNENSVVDNGLPSVVQGLLSDGEIAIQNTGNAMNRYVKISQCDLKFIHLKRIK
ncbi:hypothetical protein [Pedobacter xixiisoli]|uniref:Uncharacterized protein n=1 Tax=Pedobacter xixiisoli TaxID=1476464 RepID=A0A285ZUK8_9SPHI|nr:hypothetical protein [Pedobacter xixiisoli]SOD13335.1 hypothetical protein SAMN06297358_1162 [Pedobacter xixiisoli]